MADKLKFLYGSTADIAETNSGNSSYPAVTRGQVYFAVDQLTNGALNGQIYFDVPVGTSSAKRVLMSNKVAFATNASTAAYATLADRATHDGSGKDIADFYLSTAISVNGSTITFTAGNGTTSTITLPNTDTKVSVTSTAGHGQKMYLLVSTATTLADNNKTFTNKVWSYTGMYLDKDTGVLSVASTSALRADEAEKANTDKNGKDITAFYLSTAISLSGNTITFKNGEGTTAANITIPDKDEKLKVTSTATAGSKIYLVGNATAGLGTAGGSATSTGIVHKDIYIDTSNRINAVTTTALLASTATIAINDAGGKSITDYYLSTATTTGTDYITLKNGSGNNGPKIPNLTINSSGVIDIKHIPATAIERVKTVATQTAMYALTTADIQNGDVVHNTTTGQMFFVVDDTKLNQAAGYQEFHAGIAGAVDWGNITNRPDANLLAKNGSSISLSTGTSNAVINVTLKTYDSGNGVVSTLTIPAAATNVAGLVTTGAQTFAGNKTFSTATITKRLNYSGISASSASGNHYIWMSSTGSAGIPVYNTGLVYDSTNNILKTVVQKAKYDDTEDPDNQNARPIVDKYITYVSQGAYLSTSTNVLTFSNGSGNTSTAQIQNYYLASATMSTGTSVATLVLKNRSQHSATQVGSNITVNLPLATTTAAGIVTATDQTFSGIKTFNDGISSEKTIIANKDNDSAHSTDVNAAIYVSGGVSVKKQLSAKTIRIDNGSTTAACTLTFNSTAQVLSFVFQ